MRRGYQRDLTMEQIQADDDAEHDRDIRRRDWLHFHSHENPDYYHADCRACRVVNGEEV